MTDLVLFFVVLYFAIGVVAGAIVMHFFEQDGGFDPHGDDGLFVFLAVLLWPIPLIFGGVFLAIWWSVKYANRILFGGIKP